MSLNVLLYNNWYVFRWVPSQTLLSDSKKWWIQEVWSYCRFSPCYNVCLLFSNLIFIWNLDLNLNHLQVHRYVSMSSSMSSKSSSSSSIQFGVPVAVIDSLFLSYLTTMANKKHYLTTMANKKHCLTTMANKKLIWQQWPIKNIARQQEWKLWFIALVHCSLYSKGPIHMSLLLSTISDAWF